MSKNNKKNAAKKNTTAKKAVKPIVKKQVVKKPSKPEVKKPLAMAIVDDEGSIKTTEPKIVKKPLTDEEKRAKRNEYARAYYAKNRELLCKRSCEWHKAHPRKSAKGTK